MKYTFNTLEEVKTAIEKWFIDCGYADGNNIDKQHNKILEEIQELEDEIKNNDIEKCKDETGDVFITLVGVELKQGRTLDIDFCELYEKGLDSNLNNLKWAVHRKIYEIGIEYLNDLCKDLNIDLLECATIAYNKIQTRLENGQLKVINGTIHK